MLNLNFKLWIAALILSHNLEFHFLFFNLEFCFIWIFNLLGLFSPLSQTNYQAQFTTQLPLTQIGSHCLAQRQRPNRPLIYFTPIWAQTPTTSKPNQPTRSANSRPLRGPRQKTLACLQRRSTLPSHRNPSYPAHLQPP